ncbi:VIR protein [Plasmodium vivax]|uniref:VIR protein n=1 Tax=Plasmodium vivax TaxID=5855 RepID=A0A1G4EB68_PLAVI|nr:VIR protein [Plasmodium vivax]
MQGQRRTNNGILHTIRAFEQLKCISNYSKLKSEIEKEIDVFNQKKLNDFYKEWNKININITQKNNEIKDCVNKGHVSVDLINLDNVKNFRERCLNPKASTCRNSSPSQVRKSPELKRSGAGDSCKPGKNCKEGIAQSKEERGKSQSRALEEGSKTIGTPRTDPKHERQSNPIGQEPVNAKIISQPRPSAAHSDSHAVAEVKDHEQRDNGDYTLSNREEAQAKPLPILEPSKEKTFETHPRDQQLQTATPVESDTGDSSQVKDLDENTPQSETPHDETDSANTIGQQSYVVTVAPRTDVDGQAVATNTHVPESVAEGVSLNQNHHRGDRISATTDDLRSASAGLDKRIDIHASSVTGNSESSPVETPFTEASSDQPSGSETPCSKRKDSELVTSTGYILDTLKDFFHAIPNKDHIIQASAPMGIVLLLGLLFKYTPLWRVLTKKNRKKGAGISEELNSVLQEPSIMDEERSIPFSYGAFQYSSFDQNSY